MDLHSGARTCPASRALLVSRILDQRWSVTAAAQAAGISRTTAHKWLVRWHAEAAVQDRSSRPRHSPGRTPRVWEEMIVLLRRTRMTGPRIARELKLPAATVARVLGRHGLSRLKDLEPQPHPQRYEHRRPGDLVHLDVKKLGRIGRPGHRVHGDRTTRSRGVGWEYVHVAIDDHSRVAFAKVMSNERKHCAIAFLKEAVGYYARLGVKVERVMTDNGSCYNSFAFRRACGRLGLRHIRTKPYTPKTNGKAERFIQSSLREWAYAQAYPNSRERKAELPIWLHRYNWHRPHAGIDDKTPISKLGLIGNNVLRLHT